MLAWILARGLRPILIAAVAASCAVLGARGVGHILDAGAGELALAGVPPAEPMTPAAPAAIRSSDGMALAARNMFCSDCAPPAPAGEPGPDDGRVRETELPLELLVTSLAARDEHSYVTIRNTSSEAQGAYWRGDRIPGAGVVEHIAGNHIELRNERSGARERLSIGGDVARRTEVAPSPVTASAGPAPAAPAADDQYANMVRQTGEHRYEVDRASLQDILANPMRMKGARVMPVDGGFKIYTSRTSLLAAAGITSGDVLTAISGVELSSPDAVLEAYTKAQSERQVRVDVVRGGQPVTLTYDVR